METNSIGTESFLMPDKTASTTKISRATWVGLCLSLFAMAIIRYAFVFLVPEITLGYAILKEALVWVSAAALLIIIRRGEHLPLRSVGIGTARWWISIMWGLVIAVVSAAAAGGLAYLTNYGHGPGSAAFEALPLWLVTLIVCRAGIVEELFYRGYAIERLRMVGFGRFWSATIPLLIFSLGHWSGGAANILIALVAGAILTGFYLWRRDLVANMIGHGLVDFVANVLPALFS